MSSDLSSFHQLFKPVFVLAKVFGLFPFKPLHNNSIILITEKKDLFLPIVWFFVALSAGCCQLALMVDIQFDDKILLGVYIAYYLFLDFTALSSIIAVWINRKKVKDIFRNLFAVDQLLDRSATSVLYKQSRSSSVKSMSFVLLFITIVATCLIYFLSYDFSTITRAMCEITLSTINIMFIFQYVTIVQAIRSRYYQLWKILETLHKEKKEAVPSQIILRQQNFHLSTVVSLLNQVYGFTMLLEIMTALSNCVGSLYDGIETLNRGESPINSASIIVSGALLFVPVIWVVMSCHRAVLQNEEHITAIQELLISRSTNLSTQNELKELLLQIKLMEPQFSAGGFFTLNLQFLCTSFSSIFTYIIIMAQMK
ncbi:hypothetical protein L9F63_027185 [Diploptera punctata]|uniref:Gustatory receptor n=1 Tax=Diploptera punctata TaxID=6984 RepID=A0AAD8ENL3_DIPPU|nr:hypothetical protein L9F63_027185 [Diploptera punctata]